MDWLGLAQFVVSLVVLLVALGRWGGRLERGSKPVAASQDTNGVPSNGELDRRITELREVVNKNEKNYREDQHELWEAIDRLRRGGV